MFGRGLSISFQATKNSLTVVVGEEFGVVWKVVDEPVAGDADEYGGKTFLCRLSADAQGHAKGV
jgi:hypothetical protein